MKPLPYRQAFITGGSSGIGYAIAKHLVARGVDVTIAARQVDRLRSACEGLQKIASGDSRVETIELDITNREQVADAVESMDAAGKVPDLLVNCAGMSYPDYFDKFDSAVFDQTITVNLTGTWNMLRAMVPLMGPGSRVVNVASVSGLVGTFGYTAYSASKFGLVGLSEALRNELSIRGIGVTVLCPPDTDTPQLEQENRTKPYETKVISGNAGILSPEQVAISLFRGIKRRKFIIVPGLMGKITFLVKRFFPGLVYSIIDADAKKAHRRKNNEGNRTEKY